MNAIDPTNAMTNAIKSLNGSMHETIQAKVMGAEEVRREWRNVVDTVLTGEDVIVERYSRPAVVVIAYDDYEAIRRELEEVRATRRTNQLITAWQQGKIKTLPWQPPEDHSSDIGQT
jgi:prevent-host-death family protein